MTSSNPTKLKAADIEQELRDVNEELLVSAVRQHELIEKLEVAETALSFLGLVAASSQQSIVTVDFNGIITTWNAAAEELYGYTADEAVGKPLTLLTLPGDIIQLLANIDAIRNGETVELFDTVRIAKGGFEVNLEILLSPVSDSNGRIIGIATIARDITVRIKAEADREAQALELSEVKARELKASRRNENRLAESQMRLAIELAATQQLQEISTKLIGEGDPNVLYEKILDAAVGIMRAQFASIQLLFPERGSGGELWLLGYRGFNPKAAKAWEWVTASSKTTSGRALATGGRVIAGNVEQCEWMIGSGDLDVYRQTGILSAQSTPLVSRGGTIVGMISTHWKHPHLPSERDFRLLDVLARQAADLIERSQAEEKQRRSEERYRAIIESQTEMVCRFHPDGEVFFVNQAYASALGSTAEALAGSIFWDIVDPGDRPHVAEMLARITPETPEVRIENRLATVEGVRWSLWTNRGLAFDADGRATEVQSAGIDITERKAVEEKLRQSENELQLVTDAMPVLISYVDAERRYRFVNKTYQDWFQLSTEEIVGRTVREIIGDPGYEAALPSIEKVLSGETVGFEVLLPYKNIGPRWVCLNYVPDKDETGKVKGFYALIEDISKRKQAEDAKRDSDARLQQQWRTFNTAVSSITDFVYAFDRDGRFIFANQPLLDLWGITFAEAVGKNFFELNYPEELAARLQEQIRHVLSSKQVVKDETPYISPHGELGFYEYILSPVFAEDGSVELVAGSTRDITERRRSEEALRISDERFRVAVDAVSSLVWTNNERGEMDGAQQGWANFTGQSYEEYQGYGWSKAVHPDDVRATVEAWKEALERRETFVFEHRLRRHDGEWRRCSIRAVPVLSESGEVREWVGVHTDVTERKKIETALRASEDRLRLMVESITDYAIITMDVSGTITGWNPGAELMFGYRAGEIAGRSVNVLFTPEDRENGVPQMEMATALSAGRAEDERWHLRKDGSRFFASGVMTLLADGGPVGFVKIARDQTQRMQAEAAVNQREMLKRLVKSQEDERRRIARDMHDQLGQQMTGLRLKLKALSEMCGDNEPLCRQVDEAQDQARQIDADVSFLAFELRPTALDDLGLTTALGNFVREWSRNYDVACEFHSPKPGKRRLDPDIETNLYRIAQETLNNTLKHARAKSVNVILEMRNTEVVLIIEDDGVGFDWSDLVKNVTKSGNGLGIIGMRERAALIGGTLEIESSPDGGTTIFVRIPAKYV